MFTYEVVAMLSMDAPLALNLVLIAPEPRVWPRGDVIAVSWSVCVSEQRAFSDLMFFY